LPPNKRSEITTIESILLRSKEDLHESLKNNDMGEEHATKMKAFLEKLDLYSTGVKFPVTLKLTDPSGNSNIKNPFAPSIDKHMEIRYFKRSLNELKEMGYSIENA
jgi:C4-type Zn-finger protein